MTVYAVAQLTIHDRARYQRYVAAFMPILTKYGGRLLAADEHPEVTEGRWDGDKVVLIRSYAPSATESPVELQKCCNSQVLSGH